MESLNFENISLSVLIVLFLLWISKNLIKNFLINSIKHDYDVKIEKLKASLKDNESRMASLSNGALEGVANRKSKLYTYQLKAVQKLWNSVINLSQAKHISSLMHSLPYNELLPLAAKDPKSREVLKKMSSNFDIEKHNFTDAQKVRPFISPLAWAYYDAYQSIVMNDVIKYKMLEIGIEDNYLKENKKLQDLLITLLPEYEDYINKYIENSLFHLLKIIENKLLEELNQVLDGKVNDEDTINKANLILEKIEEINKDKNSI